MGTPKSPLASFSTDRASGGGEGVDPAPYRAKIEAINAITAQTATSTRRPSAFRAVPTSD